VGLLLCLKELMNVLVFFLNIGLYPIPALSNTQFWEPKTTFKFVAPIASLEEVSTRYLTFAYNTSQFSHLDGLLDSPS